MKLDPVVVRKWPTPIFFDCQEYMFIEQAYKEYNEDPEKYPKPGTENWHPPKDE